MEQENPVAFQPPPSNKRSLGLLLIFLSLSLFLFLGLGFYYSKKLNQVKPQTVSTKEEKTATTAATPAKKDKRYFEGLRFYEETNGQKRLLLIEGIVNQIDPLQKTVTLDSGQNQEVVQYQENDTIYALSRDDSSENKEISFSEIKIGDSVAYNPVDEKAGRTKAIWAVSY